MPCREKRLNLTLEPFPDMIHVIQPVEFIARAKDAPVVDVRSPGEFLQGHVPGAFSIPLFDDPERAVIGTLYVKSGKPDAILKGLDISLSKIEQYLEMAGETGPKGMMLLHCWRGGLRSTLMAEVFSRAGFEVAILAGGYKAYRQYIRACLGLPARIIVLGGNTGSGKTELLHLMSAMGEQVIDLEMLACHKGSVFGAMGQPPQPTNEQFENNLFDRWQQLDHSRPVWVEDESRMIGKVTLPDPVVEHITRGILIRVEPDNGIRNQRLVAEYSCFDKPLLADAIRKISEKLGGARTTEALEALETGRFDVVAGIVLAYYDKAYEHSVSRRRNRDIHDIRISGSDMDADAQRIMDFYRKLF